HAMRELWQRPVQLQQLAHRHRNDQRRRRKGGGVRGRKSDDEAELKRWRSADAPIGASVLHDRFFKSNQNPRGHPGAAGICRLLAPLPRWPARYGKPACTLATTRFILATTDGRSSRLQETSSSSRENICWTDPRARSVARR